MLINNRSRHPYFLFILFSFPNKFELVSLQMLARIKWLLCSEALHAKHGSKSGGHGEGGIVCFWCLIIFALFPNQGNTKCNLFVYLFGSTLEFQFYLIIQAYSYILIFFLVTMRILITALLILAHNRAETMNLKCPTVYVSCRSVLQLLFFWFAAKPMAFPHSLEVLRDEDLSAAERSSVASEFRPSSYKHHTMLSITTNFSGKVITKLSAGLRDEWFKNESSGLKSQRVISCTVL